VALKLRDWAGPEDTHAIQRLATELWPRGLHPGGLGWAAARGRLAEHLVLAEGDGVVGWAGVSQPGELVAQVDPGSPRAARNLVEWLLAAANGPELTIEVAHGDRVLSDALLAAGFLSCPNRGVGVGMRRPAVDRPPSIGGGYRVRNVEPGELADRVEVHRAAWKPALLPWHPVHRPVTDPEATSPFTRGHYDAVRRTWLYDPRLDLVVVAPDGSLVACCIAWFDPATGCAEIEPLGVVPEHRRRGLAGLLCLEVAARVARAGGQEVFINTGPRPDYPAPYGAYTKAGFEVVSRTSPYRLVR